ncbi:hypothetical protein BC332_30223 [Capsicum chinense]|nr:hypothetical protein BC332_30223 [Capsicum chinense]
MSGEIVAYGRVQEYKQGNMSSVFMNVELQNMNKMKSIIIEMCDAYISPSYFVVEMDDDIQFNEILEENSYQIHTNDEQVIEDDDVATLGPETESQYEIPNELLPSLNLVKSIIIHPTRCINDTTPVPMQRNKKLHRWKFSPFTTKFGSSSGTSMSASCDSSILNKKYPFTPFIGCLYDLSIEKNTYGRKDNEDCFRKHKLDMPVSLEFGVDLVNDKKWDFGIYGAAYVEFLSQEVPNQEFDIVLLLTRYAALLWDFGLDEHISSVCVLCDTGFLLFESYSMSMF